MQRLVFALQSFEVMPYICIKEKARIGESIECQEKVGQNNGVSQARELVWLGDPRELMIVAFA